MISISHSWLYIRFPIMNPWSTHNISNTNPCPLSGKSPVSTCFNPFKPYKNVVNLQYSQQLLPFDGEIYESSKLRTRVVLCRKNWLTSRDSGFRDSPIENTRPGKRLRFANLKMTILFVGLPVYPAIKGWIFP